MVFLASLFRMKSVFKDREKGRPLANPLALDLDEALRIGKIFIGSSLPLCRRFSKDLREV